MNKYNFAFITNPEISIVSGEIKFDSDILSNLINVLSWDESKVGNNKLGINKSNTNIRSSKIAQEKANVIIETSELNNIIDDILMDEKFTLSNSKSNITWFDENTMREFDIIKYEQGDFFDSHIDGKSEIDHIGTILLLPPKSIFNYIGGELILIIDSNKITINSDPINWTCVVFDINVSHKVSKILGGTRIIFKSKLYKNLNNNKFWYKKSDIKLNLTETNKITNKYFESVSEKIKKRNLNLQEKIKSLEEEIQINNDLIKTKTHPVVKRIENILMNIIKKNLY